MSGDVIMNKKFKSSFLGYNPEKVINEVEKQNMEFEKAYNLHKNRLNNLLKENVKLNEEKDALCSQMAGYKTSMKDLEKLLFETYINACTVVYNSNKNLDEMVKEKTTILKERENKNNEVNQSINNLIEQVQMILGD
jgi:predicted nuclease with TOPRIM domain